MSAILNSLIGVSFSIGTGMSLSIGLCIGLVGSFLLEALFKKQKINHAQRIAQDIIQKSQDQKEFKHAHIMSQVADYKAHLLAKHEQAQEISSQACRKIKSATDQIVHQKKRYFYQKTKQKNKTLEESFLLLDAIKKQKQYLSDIRDQLKEKRQQIISQLQKKFQIDIQQLKSDYRDAQVTRTKNDVVQWIRKNEENLKNNLDKEAYFILDCVVNRFRNPYCPERGVGSVSFVNMRSLKNLMDSNLSKLKILEKECGVDFKINDTESSITVFGIDPVRRELGRLVLQKLIKKRYLKSSDIKQIIYNTKKELFWKIRQDGEQIVRALGLKNIKTEVKNVMGALRYRYSFAQNQYFHCLEVGWLCGLLSAELGDEVAIGRRAGMLHDIGKAIDYSKEGGHAMIGADFIQKYQESADIVHAVRAHHHDVSPENPLDFLVISADALSGARPGARRSTLDSYNQKVLTLEKIGHSFPGVKDTYIMSAGREIRVIVDSKQISDSKALELSKQVARKIEEECSYPGLIKVTVVRTVIHHTNDHLHWSQLG